MLNRQQRGAVLATSLIILVVMSLLVIGMLKTSIVELRIGGLARDSVQNLANADAALIKFFNDNNGRFGKNCLVAPPGPDSCFCTGPTATTSACQAANDQTTYASSTITVGAGALQGATATQITATQLTDCIPDADVGSGNNLEPNTPGGIPAAEKVSFDVRAESIGAGEDRAVVHQGIKAFCSR